MVVPVVSQKQPEHNANDVEQGLLAPRENVDDSRNTHQFYGTELNRVSTNADSDSKSWDKRNQEHKQAFILLAILLCVFGCYFLIIYWATSSASTSRYDYNSSGHGYYGSSYHRTSHGAIHHYYGRSYGHSSGHYGGHFHGHAHGHGHGHG